MKKVIGFVLFMVMLQSAYAQVKIFGDSTRIYSGRAGAFGNELRLMNASRDCLGCLLINIDGNGLSKWVAPQFIDSMLIIGIDTFFVGTGGAETWQGTLINGPDLTQDNFSHDNLTTFTWDSLLQMNIHVINWVDIIGDKDAGREYMLKMHVNDAGNSLMAFANATIANGRFSPLIVGYQSPFPSPTTGGDLSFRGLVHPDNDIAGDPVFQFAAAGTHDDTDPNAPPLYMVNTKDIFAIGDSDLQYFMVKATGQLQLPMYVGGAFAGPAAYGLGLDALGNVIITDTSGGGGGGTTPTWQATLDAASGNVLTNNNTILQGTSNFTFYMGAANWQVFTGDSTFSGGSYGRIQMGGPFNLMDNDDGVGTSTAIIGTLSSGGQVELSASSGVSASTIILAAGDNAIAFNQSNGNYIFLNVVEFANNAAAITGGLAVGTLYRNGDVVQIVH